MSESDPDATRELKQLREVLVTLALNQAELASALAAFGRDMEGGRISPETLHLRLSKVARSAQLELLDMAGMLGGFKDGHDG